MDSLASGPASATPAPKRRKVRQRVRRTFLCILLLTVALLGRPAWHLISTSWNDVDGREPLPSGFADDVSRLNRTAVAEVWPVPSNPGEAERQLTALLARARHDGQPVSVAGARHSMGGHTIAPGGVVVDMLPLSGMDLDAERGLLRVGAGARWSEIIPYLDARGRSVGVMQSDNTFTVGGSLSVNCHGWQFGRPPICSTVESFRLMTAAGDIVRCSRQENTELFSLVLGGYGLFGIILDAELRVVPNERYRLEQEIVLLDEAISAFERRVLGRPEVAMVYARMSIVPDRFLDEVILNVFYHDPAPDGSLPPLTQPGLAGLRRSLFRGSAGSDYGKQLRWDAETRLQPHLEGEHFSRNQLLNEGSEVFADRSSGTTDILHEYFVPRDGVGWFVGDLRRIVPAHECDLLNVTVRAVDTDSDTLLRYADGPVFSFVMLFGQPRTAEGEAAMAGLAGELIEAALAAGGRYYLPYRLHATPEQFRRAYPRAERFFELKRKHDPELLFQNQFWSKYGAEP